MRVVAALFVCLVAWLLSAAAEESSQPAVFWDNKAAAFPFRVGEKLHYKVFWGIVEVGLATLEVKELAEVDGHACYRIVGTIQSNHFFSKIYPVRSVVETYLDAEGLFSRKFLEDRHEGSHARDRETILDYAAGQGKVVRKPSGRTTTFPLPKHAQDGFSTIYYLRTQPLEPDSERKFAAIGSEEVTQVTLHVFERKEMRLSGMGKIPAIRVEPSTNYESIFTRKGPLTVWVSADERKIPLLVISKIQVGSVKAELIGMEAVKESMPLVTPTAALPPCPLASSAVMSAAP